jgi:transcriptional regulator with XRE-family HTH domain
MDAAVSTAGGGVSHHIAERVRRLRSSLGLSLHALASRSGVSRSMISLVERGETSPTAVVLEKLAAGLGVTLPSLFDATGGGPEERAQSRVARRQDQPEWQDPASGYVRRNVSPAREVHFPPGGRVAFENAGRAIRVHQQVWVLQGAIDVTLGSNLHRLREGDCMAMELDVPTMFHNPTRKPARYAVVIASEPSPRR